MGVSFRISKRSTNHKLKPVITESTRFNEDADNSLENSEFPVKIGANSNGEDAAAFTGSSVLSRRERNSGDEEVSVILNLYPDGYSLVKASENDNEHHGAFQDGLKLVHPYDRASEGLFSAIESGRLPGGILDDIPCKFVGGAIMCEVRDYRKCVSHSGPNISSPSESAIVNKVSLKMSLENIVKDIPLMADDSWTYGDLMEVESRILNALQPNLCLDPVPRLDRLCQNPDSPKIKLGIVGMRKRRLRQIPEVTVTSNNRSHGKKVCIGQAPESSIYGDVMSQHGHGNALSQGPTNQRNMHDSSQGPALLPPGASPASQNIPIPYATDMNSLATAMMVSRESQLPPYPNFNRQDSRLVSGAHDGLQHHQDGSFIDGVRRSDTQWRYQSLQPRQNLSGVQYGNPGMQKYPQLVGEGFGTEDSVKLGKAEPSMVKPVTQMETEGNHHIEQFPKRKSALQSPRLSAEVSHGSMGVHSGAVSSGAPPGQVQREKSRVTSVPAVGHALSGTSCGNDPAQYQRQAQLAAKRRPKTPAMTGVGSPVSVNTMGGPLNASSPSIITSQFTEQDMPERFAKIEVVAMRHQLNRKKKKVDEFSRKPRTFSAQELRIHLSGAASNEYTDDSREMSKSLVGGHMNVCKIRVVQVQPGAQAHMLPASIRTRLILSEKPNDGTVAMHYGDLNDGDYLNSEDHLPTLPNTHWADLLAAQFCALVIREGYVVEEVLQPRPPRLTVPTYNQSNAPGGTPNHPTVVAQQYAESAEGKPVVSTNNSHNSTSNVMPNSGMLPPGNSQPLQMSQGHMPTKAQQMDPQQPPQQHQPSPLQHMPSQYQRSLSMMPNNSMPQLNSLGPAGNHMGNKSSPLQMLQQQQQQQQPQQQAAQRRMLMGLGTAAMGMGQIGNMGMGVGGLNSVMGIGGGAKGMNSPVISSGAGPMSGQNPMGLSNANAITQQRRPMTLNPQELAAAQRLNILRNRGMLGQVGAQSGVAGMSAGNRQMQMQMQMQQPGSTGLSMLNQSLPRGTIGQLQRSMAQMNAMSPGMNNAPFNQQQLQQMQQQQQQQAQQPRQQVLPTQQEATPALQSMVSPQQVSSPSTQQMNQQLTVTAAAAPQQQAATPQQQQMTQRGPMSPSLSSGPVHPVTATADACPASPLGSVGSMTHSPMDLQGTTNTTNSIANT